MMITLSFSIVSKFIDKHKNDEFSPNVNKFFICNGFIESNEK